MSHSSRQALDIALEEHQTSNPNEPANVNIGDRITALANEILRTTCGSGVHGMAIEGHDDNDEMGIYIEHPEQVLGLQPTAGHYVSRTQPEGIRSGPGDTDLTIYSLRKFMRLATAGNPTILTLLYAPESDLLIHTELGLELRSQTPSIVSVEAGWRFLGYLRGQRERMTGAGRQSRVPNRPELIEKYGYDTKYASHALRLGLQGIELIETGHLSLPLRPGDLSECMKVKRGEVSFTEALGRVDTVMRRLEELLCTRHQVLPAKPDMVSVNRWMVHAHQAHWRK